MSTYNRCDLINECIDSILNQTLVDFELIIVDDCSEDQTWSTLKKVTESDCRIRIVRNEHNDGCNVSRNRAIDMALGRYIAIVDDDDISKSDRLERQVEYLKRHTEISAIGSQVKTFTKNGSESTIYPSYYLIKRIPDSSKSLFRSILLGHFVIPNPTIMFRAEVLKEFKYPPVHYNGADVTLILQMAARGHQMTVIPEPLVLMRYGGGHKQMTSKLMAVFLGRARRVRDVIAWLKKNGITDFDHLYDRARINVRVKYLIELALKAQGFKGFKIFLQALWKSPLYVIRTGLSIISLKLSRKTF